MTITLRDFNPKETFVYLDEKYKVVIFNSALKKSGSQSKLAKFLKSKLKNPKIKQNTISIWIRQQNIRLDLLFLLCKYVNLKLDIGKIKGLKGATTSRMINPVFPIKLTQSLAILLANFYCDGSLETGINSVHCYSNNNQLLRDKFKLSFKSCFGTCELSEKPSNSGVIDVRTPKFVGNLLESKFAINSDKVPIEIKHATKEIKSAYLQAVFDDEGSVHKIHGQIRLKMKFQSYVNDIRELLEKDFNIKCSKVKRETKPNKYGSLCYYFLISGQYNLRKFYNQINFYHPDKLAKLEKRLNSYQVNSYGYGAKELVYNKLKEVGPKTTQQLAQILKRNKRTVHYHLNSLKVESRVEIVKLERKFVFEFLWVVK